MSDLFEKRMEQLKKGYEHLPNSTSPDKIWAHIKKEKPKRRRGLPWVGAAAGVVVAACIGGILIISQSPFQPGGEQGAVQVEEAQELEEPSESERDPEGNGQETELSEIPSSSRVEEKEITYTIEGTEETNTFKLLDEPSFSFSTYIPEFFQIEIVSDNRLNIYAAFTEDQEPIEEPVWSITEHEGTDLEEHIQSLKNNDQAEGGELVQEGEGEDLQYGQYFAVFEGDNSSHFTVVLFENNGKVVQWKQSYPAELGDGMAARETVLGEEWEWKNQD